MDWIYFARGFFSILVVITTFVVGYVLDYRAAIYPPCACNRCKKEREEE